MAEKKVGKKKPRRRLWCVIGAVMIVLLAVYLAVFHRVRGSLIEKPSDPKEYSRAIRRLSQRNLTIRSQEDIDDLGIVAHRIVTAADLAPGSFRVMYLPRLDTREKLHHLFHQPFTGLADIYADIWINSCTVYGHKEPTWGSGKCSVRPADKLSILIILIDRLKRGKSSLGEHIGAYAEVFTGMKLHTLPGRASCYALLMEQCVNDSKLADLAQRNLRKRTQSSFDDTEAAFWNYMADQSTHEALENLAVSSEAPSTAPETKGVKHDTVFKNLLKSYKGQKRIKG